VNTCRPSLVASPHMDNGHVPVGPMPPSPEVRAELIEVLKADQSLLGEVYRQEEAGATPADIQEARGATAPNFVWHYERIIKTLLEGDLPTARTVIRKNTRALRTILRTVTLSPETEKYLRTNLSVLEERIASIRDAAEAEDDEEIEEEVEDEVEATHEFQLYAWTYSGIPIVDGHVIAKVGYAGTGPTSDAWHRMNSASRTTGSPGAVTMLRVWEGLGDQDSAKLAEADLHGSAGRRIPGGGNEWFETDLKALDAAAAELGLERRFGVNPA
jgi:hypothetical protein